MSKGRNDSSGRAAYRDYVMGQIESGKAPHFEALTNGEGGWHDQPCGWRDQEGTMHEYGKNGFYSDMGTDFSFFQTDWDAGHTTSSASGLNEYAIEGRSANRNSVLEREGMILEKEAVALEGLSVNRDFAEGMESHGLLDSGTVDSAPADGGWSREGGLITHETESQSVTDFTTTESDTEADAFAPVELAPDTSSQSDMAPTDSVMDSATDTDSVAFEPVDLALDTQGESTTTNATDTSTADISSGTGSFEPADLSVDIASENANATPSLDFSSSSDTDSGTDGDSDGGDGD